MGKVSIISSFTTVTVIVLDDANTAVLWEASTEPYSTKKLAIKSYEMTRKIAFAMEEKGMNTVDVIVKGPGDGREACINALADSGITIRLIKDITPIPHNGALSLQRKRIRKK